MFKGKRVRIAFDSDHPKRDREGQIRLVRGKPMIPGYLGMEAAAKRLNPVAESLEIIDFGDTGYDESLPDGTDTRDILTTDLVLK